MREAKVDTGKRLKKLRESLGYTQEKMAEVLEVSVTLYKKMENGSYNISVKTLRRLKERFNVSIDYLMFGEQISFDSFWMLIQSSRNSVKLKLLLRLLVYFQKDSRECFVEKKQDEDYMEYFIDILDNFGELNHKI